MTILNGPLEQLLNTKSRQLVDVDGDYYLLESDSSAAVGDPLCYSFYGRCGIGKMMGGSLITQDGDAIEGDCLEDVTVLGKVTFMITVCHDDCRPMI